MKIETMTNKEIPIGTEIQVGLMRVKCVEKEKDNCYDCLFGELSGAMCEKICGNCCTTTRQDKKSVIFQEVKDEK